MKTLEHGGLQKLVRARPWMDNLSLFLCLDPSIEINLQYSNTSIHLCRQAGRDLLKLPETHT